MVGLANRDDTLLHTELSDHGPPHIFLTNYKTPYMNEVLAVELKLLANQIQRKDLEVLYIYRVSQEECARIREGIPYAKI